MRVGIRDLKAHLSEYIARVREGENLIVTDRGTPVARIEPLRTTKLPAKLQADIDSGRIILKRSSGYLPKPVKMTPGDKTSTDFVREQRR